MRMERHEQNGTSWNDPDFGPAPPREPHFDSTRGAWVLSRYADVAAALREKALHLASPKGKTFADGENEAERSRQFAQVRAEIGLMSTAQWRSEARSIAHRVMSQAMVRERIDLLGDITLPWCVSVLLALSGATPPVLKRIAELAACLHYKQSSSASSSRIKHLIKLQLNRLLPLKYGDAEKQLDQMLERKEVLLSKPMFLAVSQTLPSFLAKSWLALLRNPAEVLRLRANPDLMPNAVDELARYAGIVHTLFRKAESDVVVSGTRIGKGQLVSLNVASANFDPAQFADPYRLDIARRPAGQLGLGSGLHACIGAALVRQAFTALTPLLLDANPVLSRNQRIVWLGESTLRRPLAVFVNFGGLSQVGIATQQHAEIGGTAIACGTSTRS
jgi:cytochrome P450